MKAKDQITFAIAYDFDGTLSADNMQEYDFIPKLGYTPDEFWSEAQKIEKSQASDPILAYMLLMLEKAKEKNLKITREAYAKSGKKITFFKGIDSWFERITQYGKELNINVEHYIISSGLQEIISGSSIASKFKKIFASSFMYDDKGNACWPSVCINYTTKTQYLFRINKGTLDLSDHYLINEYIRDEERHVPFSRMLFIGDGSTDIPSFRLMKAQGGHAIAVYNKSEGEKAKERVQKIACNGHRVSLIFDTDYSEGSAIENAVKSILQKAAAEYNLFKLEEETRKEFEIKD